MNSNQQLNPDEHPSTIERRQSMLIKLPHSTQQAIFAKSTAFSGTPRLMGSVSTNNYLCNRHPEIHYQKGDSPRSLNFPIALNKQFPRNPRFLQAPRLMGSHSTHNYLCTRRPEMPLCVDSQWEEWGV
ncbi:hypothetical protein CEXT_422661 [Caerostris extrusa]|uniref:Uncharacterized protein n=1 Tax=Caerostris extrusa TaxID=172846 RepID=A0AAV4XZR5_CAEEX|nr:hypothetical protein CEXT_422661 [Caerostris extrusa]